MLKLLCATACAAITVSLATPARAGDYTGFYFLPRAKVAGVATQVLVSCPVGLESPGVETVGVIGVKYGPDPSRLHKLSLSTNDLFAGRNVEITLREDGTASAVTLEAKGAGGEAIAAFSKAIASAVKLAGIVPPAAPPPPLCRSDIAVQVAAAEGLSDQISRMETQLENKSGEEAVRARNEIDKARARLTQMRAKLTITTPIAADVATDTSAAGPWGKDSAAVDFSVWFNDTSDARVRALPGAEGFRLEVTASSTMAAAVRGAAPKKAPSKSGQHIAYVRPIPAAASLCALKGGTCGTQWDAVQASASLPQISPLFYLPARSGLFANRTVKATFAESGAPTALSYRTQAQAGELAKGLAGVIEAGEALRDADQAKRERELKELKTKVDLEKARDELEKLLAEP